MFRGDLTPRKVLAYIDRLPSWSAFAEASAQDDELAEMYAERDDSAPVSPLVREWTPERSELVRLNEAIQSLTAVVVKAAGGDAAPPRPAPRPATAFDRLRARIEDASYDYLLEQIEEARKRGS